MAKNVTRPTFPEDADVDNTDDPEADDAWQKDYVDDRSWEAVQEDEYGRLRPMDSMAEQREKRKRLSEAPTTRIRRGMIRYLFLVIDLSRAAAETDMRPTRMSVMGKAAEKFIREYFDQNPLSQLGLAIMRDGVASLLTHLSGTPDRHVKSLRSSLKCSGDASLQNGIELVMESLEQVPSYGRREILILYSSLTTCDPGDIMATLQNCQRARITCSLIGLSAEVYICRQLCEKTAGKYGVALNESHLEELLLFHAPPPPTSQGPAAMASNSSSSSMVRMGFPQRGASDSAAICGCHLELKLGPLYTCPRCSCRLCELPTQCNTCDLTLVSSPHLARSYHHLFPVPVFQEVPKTGGDAPPLCFGCNSEWVTGDDLRLACSQCKQHFCFDCDLYIHDSLHNCPGCECLSAITVT